MSNFFIVTELRDDGIHKKRAIDLQRVTTTLNRSLITSIEKTVGGLILHFNNEPEIVVEGKLGDLFDAVSQVESCGGDLIQLNKRVVKDLIESEMAEIIPTMAGGIAMDVGRLKGGLRNAIEAIDRIDKDLASRDDGGMQVIDDLRQADIDLAVELRGCCRTLEVKQDALRTEILRVSKDSSPQEIARLDRRTNEQESSIRTNANAIHHIKEELKDVQIELRARREEIESSLATFEDRADDIDKRIELITRNYNTREALANNLQEAISKQFDAVRTEVNALMDSMERRLSREKQSSAGTAESHDDVESSDAFSLDDLPDPDDFEEIICKIDSVSARCLLRQIYNRVRELLEREENDFASNSEKRLDVESKDR